MKSLNQTNRFVTLSASIALGLSLFSQSASASIVPTDLRTNTSAATAFNIDGFFSTEFVNNIETDIVPNTSTIDSHDVIYINDSDLIPHATINAKTTKKATQYISFTVSTAGTRGIFDIDDAELNELDSYISLLDSDGNTLLAFNDDALLDENLYTTTGYGEIFGRTTNSYLQYDFTSAGLYFLEIGAYYNNSGNAGNRPDPWKKADDNISYVAHISLDSSASVVPVPASIWLLGSGLLGLVAVSRRK